MHQITTESDFRPPRLLANAHLQTLLASIAVREPWLRRREVAMQRASQAEILPAGDGIRLQGHLSSHGRRGAGSRPLATLIHGWLGCHQSRYLRSCAALLYDAGFDVFRLNLRDHGGTEALNRELFHSCRIDEVVAALLALQQRYEASARLLGGFSLGGNFALRVAARAATAGLELDAVVAVCPVLDPRVTMRTLDQGPVIYRQYFLRRWHRSLAAKKAAFADYYADLRVNRRASLGQLTEQLVCRYAGFPDLHTYLRGYAVVDEALAEVRVPTRLIAAADDPINPEHDLARLARPAALSIERHPGGGHCGFVDRLDRPSWVDRHMLELFSEAASCA